MIAVTKSPDFKKDRRRVVQLKSVILKLQPHTKMKRNYIGLTCLFVIGFLFHPKAQTDPVPVFTSGEDGHKIYRIPAIITAPNGDLLAFCEGRVHGGADFGDINLVMKRSTDKGKTWSSLQTLLDYDSLQAGNPAPVVDKLDPAYPGGRIFLFYNTGNNHENEVRKGKGLREVWYITSTDNGQTWSDPVNITTQVHRPNQPQVNPAYNFKEDWRSYANTPGHAMQFEKGNYKGRIYIAANHSQGDPQNESTDYFAHGYYSDDHGKTFRISENINIPGSNEALAAELSNSRIILNVRNQRGDIRSRIIATSSDGGATWDTAYFDNRLPDPICQGSIITLGTVKKKNIIAVSNVADTKKRDNLVVRVSYDEGKTWPQFITIAKAPENFKGHDWAAYSDLVVLNKKEIGVLYEAKDYRQIVYTAVSWR